MNKIPFRSLTLGAALAIALVGTASAGVINFSSGFLGSSSINYGVSETFAGTGLSAIALVQPQPSFWQQSFGACNATFPCLYYKYSGVGSDETGLGLANTPDDEINFQQGIGLTTAAGTSISTIELGSVQATESWAVQGCVSSSDCTTLGLGVGDTAGILASGVTASSSGDTVTLNGLGIYGEYVVSVPFPIDFGNVVGGGDNILIDSVTTVPDSVPEPGTLALMAAGLLGLGWMLRRRRAL